MTERLLHRIPYVLLVIGAATLIAAPSAQQTAFGISGRVVSADDGRAIPNAKVACGIEGSNLFSSGTTNGDGRFGFTVHPGRYRVSVIANGYVGMEFGEEPNIGGTLVVVTADAAPQLELKLNRGGTIAGIVINDLKEPVVNAEVRAISEFAVPDQRRFLFTGSARTDDRGAYRLIGLSPGQYVVGVADGPGVTYAPAAESIAAAQKITVALNGRADANIRTKPSPSGAIEGAMAGVTNAGASVNLIREGDDIGIWPAAAVRIVANRFSFADVPVGRYSLIVRPGVGNAPRAWGREPVTVTTGATSNPTLTLRTGGTVSGQGISPLPQRGPIEITPIGTGHPEAAMARGSVLPDGSFVIANVAPGNYRWEQAQQITSSGQWLLSAYLKNEDITDVPLTVGPDSAIENIRIALTQPGRISGTVTTAKGAMTSAGAVVVTSVDDRFWGPASRRIRVARADTTGHFQISGLPPGKYRVAHVDRLSPGQLWDAAFLRSLAKEAEITVGAGATATVDLRLK